MLPEFPSGDIRTASGSGTLFSVEFDILGSGSTSLTIAGVMLRDSDNNNMPVDYSSGSINVLLPVRAKVFLQGPFVSTEMNTTLNSGGFLPIDQPYDIAPWNYNGTESVASDFFSINPNIVDWALLEVRSDLADSTKLGEKAGFLLNDGNVVGVDGVSPIYFDLNPDNYYVVIKHRNHLSIINAASYSFSRESVGYDFTDAQSKAYGSEAIQEIAPGIFGMYAGDANSDGSLTGTDFNIFNPLFRSAASGYLSSDFNMDGSITGTDFNMFNPNFRNARSSQVP